MGNMEISAELNFLSITNPNSWMLKYEQIKKNTGYKTKFIKDEIQYACWVQKFGLPQFAEEIPLLNSTKMELIEPKGDSFMKLIGPEVTGDRDGVIKGL